MSDDRLTCQTSDLQRGDVVLPARSAWFTVSILMLVYGASMLDRTILDLLVDKVQYDFRVTDGQMGLLLGSAFALPYVLCSLPLGWASDRYSRRAIIAAGLLIWGSATFACGLADTYLEFFAARCFVGVGEAALLPAAYSMIGDMFPKERLTFAISVFSMGAMAGIGLSLLLGGWLVAAATRLGTLDLGPLGHSQPWQTVFLLCALPAIVLIFAILFLPEPRRRPPEVVGGRETDGMSLAGFVRRRWKFLACHIFGFRAVSTRTDSTGIPFAAAL